MTGKGKVVLFKPGSQAFRATGVSRLRVTRAGKPETLEVRIKSYDMNDPVIRAVMDAQPRPPVITQLVSPSSELGKELGIRKPTPCRVHDTADPTFLREMEKWRRELTMAVVAAGLDEPFEDADGKPVTDPAEKVKILGDCGLSIQHLEQLADDIRKLTSFEDEALAETFRT